MYSTSYGRSYAIVIGIDQYQSAPPLSYAVSDAVAVADVLVSRLGFKAENVAILTDQTATRSAVLKTFLALAQYGMDHDDRLIVFFAGHGHTVASIRGEVGYLVPVDGDPADLSTLLRWDDLTRNADLIRAKHILFIMDACYGGLAVTRSFSPGAMRFLRDMMTRVSRQVLTAGKADEVVSDSGGPRPNHSVFTGHLLEALEGKAEDNEGNLTANGVIAYVYQAVGRDHSSQQTPHYGYLHGDGDLIFYPLPSGADLGAAPKDERLVAVPAILSDKGEPQLDDLDRLKELIAEPKHRIQLHDFMAQQTREALSRTADDYFAVHGQVTPETFVERLHKYETAIDALIPLVMVLARWGEQVHLDSLTLPIKRLSERIQATGGMTFLVESRWYPIFLLIHAAGIGSIAGGDYSALFRLVYTPVANPFGHKNGDKMIMATFRSMAAIYDAFKWFPGHDRQHVPRSEYLYKYFQPVADDTLFIGSEYDSIFDRLEIILALEYSHIDHPAQLANDELIWAPVGRFGWKSGEPIEKLIAEAQEQGGLWPPLVAGFFGRSHTRFLELAQGLSRRVARAGWY